MALKWTALHLLGALGCSGAARCSAASSSGRRTWCSASFVRSSTPRAGGQQESSLSHVLRCAALLQLAACAALLLCKLFLNVVCVFFPCVAASHAVYLCVSLPFGAGLSLTSLAAKAPHTTVTCVAGVMYDCVQAGTSERSASATSRSNSASSGTSSGHGRPASNTADTALDVTVGGTVLEETGPISPGPLIGGAHERESTPPSLLMGGAIPRHDGMPIEVEQMTSRTAIAAQAAKREAAAANDIEPGTAEETEVRAMLGN